MVAARTGAVIKFVRLGADMSFDMEQFRGLISGMAPCLLLFRV